jgi:hypothetical protein
MSLPARSEEVTAMLGELDPLVIQRVLETGATVDEIGEGLRLAADDDDPTMPSSSAVVEVRGILYELFDDEAEDYAFPIEGVRI